MHQELVEKRGWISESRFLHALNYCMLLPGPEAQQLATYVGWLLHGIPGGLASGSLFVLPSALLLWALSWLYASWGTLPWVAALFDGLQPAVLAIVAAAVVRIGSKVLKNPLMVAVAAAAFAAIFALGLPFPLIVLASVALGFLGQRLGFHQFLVLQPQAETPGPQECTPPAPPSWGRALRILSLGLSLWAAPVLLCCLFLGPQHVLVQQGLFFSKAAMITFGGAYAVLPYVAQQAVEHHGWLSPAEMLDGLGLAESTPGPLIIVLQFVGFQGGWKFHEPFSPLVGATLAAAITTWTTFVPCFLWIFLGAPYIERLRQHRGLTAALSAVTAAVVGVILNLALWLGWKVVLPDGHTLNIPDLVLTLLFLFGLVRLKWGLLPVIVSSALLGWIRLLLA